MPGFVNSSGLMQFLPGPAVDQAPPLLSDLGHPLRQDHPVVGTSTITVSVPEIVAPPRPEAAVAVIPHSFVDVPNFVPIPSVFYSPVHVFRLAEALHDHPDYNFVNFLLNGFSFGFDIGFRGSLAGSISPNLRSALAHPTEVSTAINKELARGHTAGSFVTPPFQGLHCSPLGAVQKKDGSYRLILDLSFPHDTSVNDGISRIDHSVHYSSFDDAVDLVRSLGHGCLMSKIDIKHAFRLCPVRPQDYKLLGMWWQGRYYVHTRLPFGGRSSPFIFNSFADALAWIIIFCCGIPSIVHYLDDFFVAASSVSHQCQNYVDTVVSCFTYLGIPIAVEKLVLPTTRITFLGIEIDSVDHCIRQTNSWNSRIYWPKKKSSKRELLSLIGKLSFAAKVIKPGRIFLRRLIDLSKTVSKLHFFIDINLQARLDILWWHQFISDWNGVSFIQEEFVSSDSITLYTDASGVLGFGAVYKSHWFSLSWPHSMIHHNINFKELFAIIAAVHTWSDQWADMQITFMTDNSPICDIWRKGSSLDHDIMCLVRHLFFHAAI